MKTRRYDVTKLRVARDNFWRTRLKIDQRLNVSRNKKILETVSRLCPLTVKANSDERHSTGDCEPKEVHYGKPVNRLVITVV